MTSGTMEPPVMSGIEMYREHILQHYKSPCNYGTLDDAQLRYREDNPLCGDDIEMQMVLDGAGAIDRIAFHGQGCAICQASASLVTESVKGKDLATVKAMGKDDVLELLQIPISAVRMKCALLPLSVIHGAIRVYEQDGASP